MRAPKDMHLQDDAAVIACANRQRARHRRVPVFLRRLFRCIRGDISWPEGLHQETEGRVCRELGGYHEGECLEPPLSIVRCLLMAPQMFYREALMWKRLIHPNIVPFRGVTIDPFQIVSEWISGGDLVTYIDLNPHTNRVTLVSILLHPLTDYLSFLSATWGCMWAFLSPCL